MVGAEIVSDESDELKNSQNSQKKNRRYTPKPIKKTNESSKSGDKNSMEFSGALNNWHSSKKSLVDTRGSINQDDY